MMAPPVATWQTGEGSASSYASAPKLAPPSALVA
jgi:hypothetical protein